METSYILGTILGALLSGAIVGAVPAICGAIKQKIGLAVGGFFACLAASLLLGLILSVPVCAVFLLLIFRKKKPSQSSGEASTQSSDQTNPDQE